MSDTDVQRTLGAHDADIKNIKDRVEKIDANVDAIRSAVDQGKGGWKVIMWLGSVSGAMGGLIGWFAANIMGRHP